MKTIMCLDCDKKFTAETKEAVLKAMMPHYLEAHKDVMEAGNEAKKNAWFGELERRWDTAKD